MPTAHRSRLKPLLLVDASIYIFRAYFAMPDSIRNGKGQPANALYGFASFLGGLLAGARPDHIAAMFDESLGDCFRNEVYADYKSNRALPDPDLERQLRWCREITELAGVRTYASNRFEADDLIGTVAQRLRPHGFRMVYVTGDKDIGQLLGGRDYIWDYPKNLVIRARDFRQRFGVRPNQMADYLGLAGDAVDCIPGVPGIGPKTACQLLGHFGSLDKLFHTLQHKSLADTGLAKARGIGRIDSLLRDNEPLARLSRQLATISTDAPLRPTPASLRRKRVKKRALQQWLDANAFGSNLAARLRKI